MCSYSLKSDNAFIRGGTGDGQWGSANSAFFSVYEYDPGVGAVDQNATVEMPMNAPLYSWKHLASLGISFSSVYSQLEVNGVRIPFHWWPTLANDLTITGKNGQKFNLMVNRQGLCLLDITNDFGPMKWLRINDRFGWSKYGVKVPRDGFVTWSVRDMNNGYVLVDGLKKEEEEKDAALVPFSSMVVCYQRFITKVKV